MYIDKPKYFEYTSAAVPVIKDIKPSIISPNNQSHNSVTTPNLFARYFTFNNKGDRLNDNLSLATSHEYYIIQGSGKTIIINQDGFSEIKWNKGDVLVLPFIRGKVVHIAFEDKTMIFTADDKPIGKKCAIIDGQHIPSKRDWETDDDYASTKGEKWNASANQEILLSNTQKRIAFEGHGILTDIIVLVMEIIVFILKDQLLKLMQTEKSIKQMMKFM